MKMMKMEKKERETEFITNFSLIEFLGLITK